MNDRTFTLCRGVTLFYEGDAVEVTELSGTTVVLRNDRTSQFTSVSVSHLIARAHPASAEPASETKLSSAVVWSGLTEQERIAVTDRAGHVREMLTGYRSGHPGNAASDEPRPEYGRGQAPSVRYRAKAKELGVSERTLRRWVTEYLEAVRPAWLIPGPYGAGAALWIPAGMRRSGWSWPKWSATLPRRVMRC